MRAAPSFLLATALLALGQGAAAAPELVERKDVGASFSAAACAQDAVGSPLKAWSAQVFDAQIDGRLAQGRPGQKVEREALLHKARALARVRRYQGYAAGHCEDGTGWAAAFPAPHPLHLVEGKHLDVPLADLNASCESWRVDFAPAAGGQPRRLTSDSAQISLQGLGDGTVSVTCQPQRPRWQGPVLWFLAPVGKGPNAEAPEIKDLAASAGGAPLSATLATWINRVRVGAKLAPVSFTDELSAEAGILAIDSGLTHNRTLLKRIEGSLDSRKLKLLGENRVKGSNPELMAWLLWNSPRHRDLLLDKDARLAGITQKEVRGETLTVIIFAQDARTTTAKAHQKPSSKAVR